MKPEPHLVEDSSDLGPQELEAIFKTARRQAERTTTSAADQNIDWRTLGYVVLGGSIIVLLALQFVG